MNLIPTSWKTLWDVWYVRMLVLLSLTLQIILFIFGKRRKNISSQWIKVIVWLAYIMADWVATVALGKLSNNIPNPNNALQPFWAPLLLLHLGGPDTITAYSLEDNQLWIRHLFGMSVQVSVAIYVIVMLWRHFWFSFMLIPAFVAGIIKYGERTWALKLACHDKLTSIVPLYYRDYCIGGIYRPIFRKDRDEQVLTIAHTLVNRFKDYIENYDIGRYEFAQPEARASFLNAMNQVDATYIGDILEVEMGFVYDLLYTKAPITFTKRGCIFRSISFICTVSVLVGFFRIIAMEAKWQEQHYSMVDIVITGVLLVGALALEIYAGILLLFSDWAMVWLLNCGRGKWAIRLLQKFPWCFEKKKWSKKMGQIDLFEEEDKRPKWRRILGRRFGKTSIPQTLYPMIIQFIYRATATDNLIDLGGLKRFIGSTAFHDQILIMHTITNFCYRDDDTFTEIENMQNSIKLHENDSFCYYRDDVSFTENSANSRGHQDDKETCKILSNYMMYLLLTCRSVLPVIVSNKQLENFLSLAGPGLREIKGWHPNGGKLCPSDMTEIFVELKIYVSRGAEDEQGRKDALVFFLKDLIIELDNGNKKVKWEKLKLVWLGMLCYAAISCPKNYHLQKLREGGELLNLVWFLIPQSRFFCGVSTFTLNDFFKKCFQSMPDVGTERPLYNEGS